MSEQIGELVIATVFLFAGVVILTNLDALVDLDQSSGLKTHAWFKKKLGANSAWNREIYSVGTASGRKRSKVGFAAVGILCLLAGFIALSVLLTRYLR